MKICFWGKIANALNGNTIGGGELQMALLAKALARKGNEVVVLDTETEDDFITEDGIQVYKIKDWNKGIPFLRIFTHQIPNLYKSLLHQKADIYYCRIREFRHIIAYWVARRINAKFVLGIASDMDVLDFKNQVKYNFLSQFKLWNFLNVLLTALIYPWLFKNSDLVLAQHQGQKSILDKKGAKSVVFPNLFEYKYKTDEQTNYRKNFIYVGSLSKRKGFPQFFELIKKAPWHKFVIVGQPKDKIAFKCYEELKSFPNVTLCGRLSHSQTIQNIQKAKAMISTSPMEGFPNVFLEAWANGIPVISLHVDPGNIIKGQKLGFVANGDMSIMLNAMKTINNSNGFAQIAKSYIEKNHELNSDKIEKINLLFSKIKKGKDVLESNIFYRKK